MNFSPIIIRYVQQGTYPNLYNLVFENKDFILSLIIDLPLYCAVNNYFKIQTIDEIERI